MFTGIVEEVGQLLSITGRGMTFSAGKVLLNSEIGASIAVNGVCLTVTGFNSNSFTVDVMEETIKRTNLAALKVGSAVNLESALTLSKGLGGHLVQGHVDGTGRVVNTVSLEASLLIDIEAGNEVMRYVVEKGFITVDGVSLTVVRKGAHNFQVSIVGFTRQNTTLGQAVIDDKVNLEADIIAKYVEQYSVPKTDSISMEFLHEHGFA
ncbi:MAG: riboflavin synthase [Dehalococcoidia bacterium]|nr:riboflavin synthase [Dehalococcoidia bacterium]